VLQVLTISVSVSVKIMLRANPVSRHNRVSRVSKPVDHRVLHPVQDIRVIVLTSGIQDPDREQEQQVVLPVLISGISHVHRIPLKLNQQIKKFRIR
jgi:hypothetical protein